ncbi:hypothetical protein [Enterococcus pseudoavium]|uniref:hypothetical protein n=1 Tax=Enterococcus pseudoavium TaxID=44007 RepID=UPI003F9485B2
MKNNKDSKEPIIKLQGYTIDDLHYTSLEDQVKSVPDGFKLTPSIGMTKDLGSGKITLDVSLKLKGDQKKLDPKVVTVRVTAFFDISEDLTDEDAVGQALIVNGTAIVFPYIRSIVSMVTGLDSEQTVLLPTIATSKLFSDKPIDL